MLEQSLAGIWISEIHLTSEHREKAAFSGSVLQLSSLRHLFHGYVLQGIHTGKHQLD